MAEYSLQEIFEAQQRSFAGDVNPGWAARDGRLARLAMMTEMHGDDIAAAISADFSHRSLHETALAEVFVVLSGINHARSHLKAWMKTRRVGTKLHFFPGYSRIMRQPLGVVGIISPWNYPFQLAIAPAIGAIAAGNRVLIKPSETVPNFSALLKQIIGDFFPPEELAVVEGDVAVAGEFARLPFDHLFFTGSTTVGRQVAQAAAQNLTPLTLELGGKSPAIIDASCDYLLAAPRLMAGKLLNAGQTCIAPDYLLLPAASADREEELAALLVTAAARLYPRLADNSDYTSIISARHFDRLEGLLEDARAKGARVMEINPGKEVFTRQSRKLPPHLVLGATEEMAVMQEEIFGPILPVMRVSSLAAAIAFLNRRPRPLALYWFGQDSGNRDEVLGKTIAGGVSINDTLLHVAQEELPFGGVGASGYGEYHGERGFLSCSKEKPVFLQRRFAATSLLYPPYGKTFARVMAVLRRLA